MSAFFAGQRPGPSFFLGPGLNLNGGDRIIVPAALAAALSITGAIVMDDVTLTIDSVDQVFLLQEAIEQFLDRVPPRLDRMHDHGQRLLDRLAQLTNSIQAERLPPAA